MKCFIDVVRISVWFDDLKVVLIFNVKDFIINIDFWLKFF